MHHLYSLDSKESKISEVVADRTLMCCKDNNTTALQAYILAGEALLYVHLYAREDPQLTIASLIREQYD